MAKDKRKEAAAVEVLDEQAAALEIHDNGAKPLHEAYDFVLPGPDERGYLKRMRAALRFKWLIESGFEDMTFADIDELVEFLAGYFEGIPLEEAKEVLFEASENEFVPMLNAILAPNSVAEDGDLPKESKPPRGVG